jgi:hypothetical protein
MTPDTLEDRLRHAVDRFVAAAPLAHPDRPRPVAPGAGPRHAFRLSAGKAAGVAVTVVVAVAVVLGLVLVGGPPPRPRPHPLHEPPPARDVMARYPPIIPQTVPDRGGCLTLPSVGLSEARAQTIMSAVQGLAPGHTLAALGSCTGGPVTVTLAPGQESLAHVIWSRYGADVALTVGLTAYHGTAGRSARCGSLEPPLPLPSDLAVALRLQGTTVRSGADLAGKVVLTYRGTGSFAMDTGQPLEAVVVRPGTRQVVGVDAGAIAGTGDASRITDGQSESISIAGGTARCDGGLGSALPPGRYQVLVRVAPETTPLARGYLTPPVTIRVTR